MNQTFIGLVMIKIYLLSFVLLLSCGKRVNEDSDEDSRQEELYNGTYSAILIPVNSKISSNVHGEVKILKYGDDFQVNVRLKNAPKGHHTQYLHTGSYCPKGSQDINADGYIDGYEARTQAGNIIVPFDGDLSTQLSGSSLVLQGNYSYSRSTSYYLMLSDLNLPDEIINDPIVKLHDRDLPLERRVVMVYTKHRNWPSTVDGTEVPLACGILTRISDYPIPNDDTYQEGPREPRPRPRPRPRPQPRPEPRPDPQPEVDHQNDSWWDWVRQRWNRWRGRGRTGDSSSQG